ncbi:G-protein coupled receptor [Ignatzschineria rhizosphaerae]|uniref:G-protein coupled receptor n=1 Tax=Ignatzschineria rhizosphaerae TaxID=2923279 RepID=A0ABY3WWN4_9GAMM|nr:G-protein coupled receptor [Ignatzschineria rhizosphaerae]UNM95021.1 G-protein coupled receptor [Ignatzschineria rhizosphaerae]
MNNNNSQLAKELQHPTSKYDYDGITGTWLLIPAKIHILLLAIALPVILWMFPYVQLKGNYRYVFADYRYYIAGAVSIFCIASALLSIIKAKQVKQRIRPMSDVSRQSVTKSKNSRSKRVTTTEKKPKIHIGHIKKSTALNKNQQKAEDESSALPKDKNAKDKMAKTITDGVIKTAEKRAESETLAKKPNNVQTNIPLKPIKNESLEDTNPKLQKNSPKTSKRKKNPKQMQLDL